MSVSGVTMVTILTSKAETNCLISYFYHMRSNRLKEFCLIFTLKNNSRETSLVKMSMNLTQHVTFRFITDLSHKELWNKIYFRNLQYKSYDTMHLNTPTTTQKYSPMLWAKKLGLKEKLWIFLCYPSFFISSSFDLENNSAGHKSFTKAVQGAAQQGLSRASSPSAGCGSPADRPQLSPTASNRSHEIFPPPQIYSEFPLSV